MYKLLKQQTLQRKTTKKSIVQVIVFFFPIITRNYTLITIVPVAIDKMTITA